MATTTLRKFAAITVCLGAMSAAAPALAADLPQVPYAAPLAAYNWTGFYIGGAAGVGSTNYELDASAFGGFAALNIDSFAGDGLHLALLAGYNHQFIGSNIVAGIEGDVAFNDQDVEASLAFGGFNANADLDHEFSATIRGRLGYLLLERAMVFVTGGVAYGEFDTSASTNTGFNFDQDDNEWGWVVGGGIEVAATDNVRVRAEYLYTDYSSFDYPVGPGASIDMEPVNHTARAAVIWNFNWY